MSLFIEPRVAFPHNTVWQGCVVSVLIILLSACTAAPKPEIKPTRKVAADPVACKRDCFEDRVACYNRDVAWRCENNYEVCMEPCTP